jgi:2-polyprenyl-3-methyl-5-hydroxy-6-metoxy-1,4-benzoquinol methylase
LSRRFELAHTELVVAGRRYELLRPRNIDDLIDEEAFELDERIPYWADCWPSSRVLAERVAAMPGRQASLLELGCGIGLVSLVAAASGFQVLATDYESDALEFTCANASRNQLEQVDTRRLDWRWLPEDLGTFDVVAAADVLYERPHPALVAGVLARALSPGGVGLVADPGRRTAEPFAEECSRKRLSCRCAARVPTRDAGADLTVSVYEVRRV